MNHTSFFAKLRRIINTESLPFYFLLAYLITLTVECLARRSLIDGFIFPFTNPFAFTVNYGIILLSLLATLFGRRRIAWITLVSFFWIALGITEFVLLSFRVTPLTAVDFSILPNVLSIITIYLSPLQIIFLSLLILGAITAVVILFLKVPIHKIAFKKSLLSIFFVICAFLSSAALGMEIKAIDTSFPNLATAYKDYGFAYCFSMSVFDKGIDKPENYSKETIDEILSSLPEEKASENTPNVIVVQLESFFDVNRLTTANFSENPLPNFTALMDTYQSGLLKVPVIGAGTVNTEFEVLTGMNVLHFGAGEYPYKSVLKDKTCESLAYTLSRQGLTAHAIHNHQGTFYARHEIYKNLGFSTFTPLEGMLDPTFNETKWAEDAILTNEILSSLASTDGQDFVFAVSVQGHGKYPTDYIAKPDDITVTEGFENDPQKLSQYTYYINQIKQTDAFVKTLYDAVMALDEPTVLLLYGDHLPALSIEDTMLTSGTVYQTEYVLLSNYDKNPAADRDLSSYRLYSVLMETIGCTDGMINRFHQSRPDTEEAQNDLKLLEYDLLYGNNYADLSDTAYPKHEDMSFGTREIVIEGYEVIGNTLTVTGQNFTPYSVIVLDEREQKTVYLDRNTLQTTLSLTERNFESLSLRQNTKKGETLFETDRLIIPRKKSDRMSNTLETQ